MPRDTLDTFERRERERVCVCVCVCVFCLSVYVSIRGERPFRWLVRARTSKRTMPNDQTSDFVVKRPDSAASGAVHLIGNLASTHLQRNDTRNFICAFSEIIIHCKYTVFVYGLKGQTLVLCNVQ